MTLALLVSRAELLLTSSAKSTRTFTGMNEVYLVADVLLLLAVLSAWPLLPANPASREPCAEPVCQTTSSDKRAPCLFGFASLALLTFSAQLSNEELGLRKVEGGLQEQDLLRSPRSGQLDSSKPLCCFFFR